MHMAFTVSWHNRRHRAPESRSDILTHSQPQSLISGADYHAGKCDQKHTPDAHHDEQQKAPRLSGLRCFCMPLPPGRAVKKPLHVTGAVSDAHVEQQQQEEYELARRDRDA